MRLPLPQRFRRVPSEDPMSRQQQDDISLSPVPSQAKSDAKDYVPPNHDAKTDIITNVQPTHADTAYSAGAWSANTPTYRVTHRKNLIETLEHHEHHRFGTKLFGTFYDTFVAGWRAGMLRAFMFSFVAVVANVSIYAWLFATYDAVQGTGTIMNGSCRQVRNANIGIHAALNVVSTLVLGASTYAMQGLTAPTRKEVDVAHSKGKWVEIGTPSMRNLFHVRRRNLWLWLILGLSSLPFHLFFNAVFFTASQTNQYAVAVIQENYLTNTNFRPSEENSSPDLFDQTVPANAFSDCRNCTFDIRNVTTIIDLLSDVRSVSRNAEFARMDPLECMSNYSTGFMRTYGDVVVVSSRTDAEVPVLWTRFPHRSLTVNETSHEQGTIQDPFHWICHDKLDFDEARRTRCDYKMAMEKFDSGKNWTVYGNPVSHCYARISPLGCKLQFNAWLMLAVVVFGIVKSITLCYLVFWRPAGRFLRTLGDAVASYLEEEDPTTKNMCLVTSKQVRKHGFQTSFEPQIFTGERPRWLTSANTIEFFATIGVTALYIITLGAALFMAIDGAKGYAFANGLGIPDIQSLASFQRDDTKSSGIVPTLLVANIPQLGFSLLYVAYTNTWNKLLVAHEFDRLTQVKKGLRVSERPRGMQRASRFFTLPVRYALPLMTCSAAIHWLCSQSLFMVRIDGVDSSGETDPNDQLVRLGYSATGIVSLIAVSVGLMVATICVGMFRRLRTVLGETSMSVVISAACHQRRYEPEPWLQEVQWGDVTSSMEGEGGKSSARHCAFTTSLVARPIVGEAYQ